MFCTLYGTVSTGLWSGRSDHQTFARGFRNDGRDFGYLSNGGALEHAQEMAAQESPRTTKLYDRTKERLTQDEVERIRF